MFNFSHSFQNIFITQYYSETFLSPTPGYIRFQIDSRTATNNWQSQKELTDGSLLLANRNSGKPF